MKVDDNKVLLAVCAAGLLFLNTCAKAAGDYQTWEEVRVCGIPDPYNYETSIRVDFTSTVQEFIRYAEGQGANQAASYYYRFVNLVEKESNKVVAESTVTLLLKDAMKEDMPYRDVFDYIRDTLYQR